MKLLTAAAMKALDKQAVETVGIPSLVLMENAGRAVVSVMKRYVADLAQRRIVVLSGKGNNGGDGLVAARVLSEWGCPVEIFLLTEVDCCSEETVIQCNILEQSHIPFTTVPDTRSVETIKPAIERAGVVLDAMLGIGIRGAARGHYADIIELLNEVSTYRVALDTPSGLDADTGQVAGPCVKADLTITLGLPKTGLLFYPGRDYAGRLEVADIGYPKTLIQSFNSELSWLDRAFVQNHLPLRPANSHKGSFGKLALVAGSRGMSGAALLAANAALRSGVGLLHLAYPESLDTIISTQVIEAVKHPLPEENGALGQAAFERLSSLLAEVNVLALGPGLSQQPCTQTVVRKLIESAQIPLLIDADGLNALVGHVKLLKQRQAPTVITPHLGEFSRLCGLTIEAIEAQRLQIARQFSQEHEIVLVLKGTPTVIAMPDGDACVNTTGHSGLAKGGSGDVLTGLIAGLLAQGMSPEKAAACGAWLHGHAADSQERLGQRALLPQDLINALPQVFRSFEGNARQHEDKET